NLDPRMDVLSERIQAIAADADRRKQSRFAAFLRIWQAAHQTADLMPPELQQQRNAPVPFLSEPWYCCAEPTKDQLVAIGAPAKSNPAPLAASAVTDFV